MSSDIKELVQSIRKHSNFKRLAAYSIQSLCKKCTPPSNGWQIAASDAFHAGACDAIAEVLHKNSRDSEIFLATLLHFQATAAVGHGAELVLTNNVSGTIITSFMDYFTAADIPTANQAIQSGLITNGMYVTTGPDAEAVAVTESFLRYLAFICITARSEAANATIGTNHSDIASCLLTLLPKLPTPNAVRLAFTALESLSRNETGLSALIQATNVSSLLTSASTVFGVQATTTTTSPRPNTSSSAASSSSSSTNSRAARVLQASANPLSPLSSAPSRRQMSIGYGLSGTGRNGNNNNSTKTGSLVRLNSHLDPAFSVLDRVSRNDQGLRVLRESQAVSQLANAVELTQSTNFDPATAALGVRILARVLGNDLRTLIDRVMNVPSKIVTEEEGEFAASLLASLALDADVAARFIAAGLTPSLVELLDTNNHQGATPKIAVSVTQAIRRISTQSSDAMEALHTANVLDRLMKTARNSTTEPRVVAETITTMAELMYKEEHISFIDKEERYMEFVTQLLRDYGAADASLATACLQFIHTCQCFRYRIEKLIEYGIIPVTLNVLTSPTSRGNECIDLQIYGELVLAAVASTDDVIETMVTSNIFAIAIANLQLRSGYVAGVGSIGNSNGSNPNGTGTSSASSSASPFPSTGINTQLLYASSLLLGRESLAYASNYTTAMMVRASARRSLDIDAFLKASDASSSTDDLNDDDGPLAPQPLFGALVAITLHLLTLLCTNENRTSTAKTRGLIRAMLSSYNRHSANDAVHDTFTDLVEQVLYESEITNAIKNLGKANGSLKDICGDPALFSIAEADLGKEGIVNEDGTILMADAIEYEGMNNVPLASSTTPSTSSGSTKKNPKSPLTKEGANTIALRMTDDLCLLQAATNSARLSALLVSNGGIPVFIRTIALTTVVKARADVTQDARNVGMKKGPPVTQVSTARLGMDDDRFMNESLQEEIIMRACDALTGLARINIDSHYAIPGLDGIPTSISNGITLISHASTVPSSRRLPPSATVDPTASASSSSTALSNRTVARKSVMSIGHRRMRSGKTVGEAFTKIQNDIGKALYRPVVYRILTKALNSRANLKALVAAASLTLGVLSLGHIGAISTTPIDAIVGIGAVEATVGGMRMHPTALHVLLATANGLGCMAIAGRAIEDIVGTLRYPAPPETIGSAAIATRGATRQIIRELQNASSPANGNGNRWTGSLGNAALASLLRVLLVVAETSKGADLLKKQGCIEALIATLDAANGNATVLDLAGDASTDGSGNASSSSSSGATGSNISVTKDTTNDSSSGNNAVANALSGTDSLGGLLSSTIGTGSSTTRNRRNGHTNKQSVDEVTQLIIAILSKLMDVKDLSEAVRMILSTAEKVHGQGNNTLKVANITLCSVALTTILALSGTDNGRKAGFQIWIEAFEACSTLVTSLSTACTQSIQNGLPEKLNLLGSGVTILLPAAIRCLSSIIRFRDTFEGVTDTLAERWIATVSETSVALIRNLELSESTDTFINDPNASSGTRTAAERTSIVYSGIALDSLDTLGLCLRRGGDTVAHRLFTSANGNGTVTAASLPVNGLVAATFRFAENGDVEALSPAIELVAILSRVSASASTSADGPNDGVSVLLRTTPSTGTVAELALRELLASSASVRAVGYALVLAGRLAHRQTSLAVTMRRNGTLELIRQSLGRYCADGTGSSVDTVNGSKGDTGSSSNSNDSSTYGPARVLEGAALLTAAVTGFVTEADTVIIPAASSSSTASVPSTEEVLLTNDDIHSSPGTGNDTNASHSDRAILTRILQYIREDASRRFIQSSRAMTAVCDLVTLLCTVTGTNDNRNGGTEIRYISAEAVEKSRTVLTTFQTRKIIVTAMSAPSADAHLLKAGARALAALGGSTAAGVGAEVRRAIILVHKALNIPFDNRTIQGDGGLLSPLDKSGPSNGTSKGTNSNSINTPTALSSPSSTAPSTASGTGDDTVSSRSSPLQIMDQLDSSLRNLSAALAGEPSLTPIAYRYLYDTLNHAIQVARTSAALAIDGKIVTNEANVTVPSTDYVTRSTGIMLTSIQAITRLLSITVSPNEKVGQMPDGAVSGVANTAAVEILKETLGPLDTVKIYDATADEKLKFGEMRNTDSAVYVTKLFHEVNTMGNKRSNGSTKVPEPTSNQYSIVPPVSLGNVMDTLVTALGVPVVNKENGNDPNPFAVSPEITDGVLRCLNECLTILGTSSSIIRVASLSSSTLQSPEATNVSSSTVTGTAGHLSFTDKQTLSKVEFLWSFCSRGLAHMLGQLLLIANGDSVLTNLYPTGTSGNQGILLPSSSSAVTVATMVRPIVYSILQFAQDATLLRYFSRMIDMHQTNGTVTSELAILTHRCGLTELPAKINFPVKWVPSAFTPDTDGSIWSCLPLSTHTTAATPITVIFQLLHLAEAVTRPSVNDLGTIYQDFLTATSTTGGGSNEGSNDTNEPSPDNSTDPYVHAHQLLSTLTVHPELRGILQGIGSSTVVAADASSTTLPSTTAPIVTSPLWILIQQIMMQGTSGGMLRLLPSSLTGNFALPEQRTVTVTSFTYMRILGEMFEVLRSLSDTTNNSHILAVTEHLRSSPHIPGTLSTIASLYGSWARSATIVLDHKEETVPPLGLTAVTTNDGNALPNNGSNDTGPLSNGPNHTLHLTIEDGNGKTPHPNGSVVSLPSPIVPLSGTPLPNTTADMQQRATLNEAITNVYRTLTRAVLFSSVKLLSYTDMDSKVPTVSTVRSPTASSPSSLPAVSLPSPSGKTAATIDAILMDGASVSMSRCLLRQKGVEYLACTGVKVIRRLCGLNSLALATKEKLAPGDDGLTLNENRLGTLAKGGVFSRVILALGLHSTSIVYTQEAMTLLHDIGLALARYRTVPNYTGKMLVELGLNEDCLRALQSATKRLGRGTGTFNNELIRTTGDRLISALSDAYSNMSSKGFLDAIERFCDAADESPFACVMRGGKPIQSSSTSPTKHDADDDDEDDEDGPVVGTNPGNSSASSSPLVLSPVRYGYVRIADTETMMTSKDGVPKRLSKRKLVSDGSTETIPEPYTLLLKTVNDLENVCNGIDSDAIPLIPSALLGRLAIITRKYCFDLRVGGIAGRTLYRATDNGGNHTDIVSTTESVRSMLWLWNQHTKNSLVAETVCGFYRPLSIRIENVQLFKDDGYVIPALSSMLAIHSSTLLPILSKGNDEGTTGTTKTSSLQDKQKAEQELLNKLASPVHNMNTSPSTVVETTNPDIPSSPSSSTGNTSNGSTNPSSSPVPLSVPPVIDDTTEPRIAQYCLQCLANIACDTNEEEVSVLSKLPGYTDVSQYITEGCSGGVARIVIAGGLNALVKTMEEHPNNPRVLEDALCALSNIAYACDGVRIYIGRIAAPLIVNALRLFTTDAYTFSMALRAVGNLTRCDENIIATVAAGVIEGIVEGIRNHIDDCDVLKLAADVIGNLASIDEAAVDRKEGLRALRAGLRRRRRLEGTGASNGIDDTDDTIITDGPGSAKSSAATGGNKSSNIAAMVARAKASKKEDEIPLQEAVSKWLLDDGAHEGLVTAMEKHSTEVDVISACLRSLLYMAETSETIERMENDVHLSKVVCYVMRSCDYDPELCIRGSTLLGQLLRYEGTEARREAVAAGAPHVLLSAVETHRTNVQVFTNVFRTVITTLSGEQSTIAAAKELGMVKTILTIMDIASKGLVRLGGVPMILANRRAAATGTSSRILRSGTTAATVPVDGENPEDTILLGTAHAASINTLASATGEEYITILRQSMSMLNPWASDPELGPVAAVPVSNVIVDMLKPGPASSFTDVPLVEACFIFLVPFATISNVSASNMATQSGLPALFRSITVSTTSTNHMDRPGLVNATLDIVNVMARSTPLAAVTLLDNDVHAMCQGIAVHWAIKRLGEDHQRKSIYEKAGNALRAMTDNAVDIRIERAIQEARMKAQRAVAEASIANFDANTVVSNTATVPSSSDGTAVPPSVPSSSLSATATAAAVVPDGIDGMSKAQLRARREQSIALIPKPRDTEDKLKEKAERAREKEAVKLAKTFSKRGGAISANAVVLPGTDATNFRPADVLEMRAGLIPWALFPRSTITDLAGAADVTGDVWFLPDMHEKGKVKVRTMRLTVSSDLRKLSWAYTSRRYNKVLEWSTMLAQVMNVRVGLPSGNQRKRFFILRNANTVRSLVLEDETHTVFHAEIKNGEKLDALLRALHVLVQYARAREANTVEPLPSLPSAAIATALASLSLTESAATVNEMNGLLNPGNSNGEPGTTGTSSSSSSVTNAVNGPNSPSMLPLAPRMPSSSNVLPEASSNGGSRTPRKSFIEFINGSGNNNSSNNNNNNSSPTNRQVSNWGLDDGPLAATDNANTTGSSTTTTA